MARQRTSTDYAFTTDSYDAEAIRSLRLKVQIENLERRLAHLIGGHERFRTRLSVRVRPRLGADSPHAHLYRRGGPLRRPSSQDIRPEHGSRFDVYVYEVRR